MLFQFLDLIFIVARLETESHKIHFSKKNTITNWFIEFYFSEYSLHRIQ